MTNQAWSIFLENKTNCFILYYHLSIFSATQPYLYLYIEISMTRIWQMKLTVTTIIDTVPFQRFFRNWCSRHICNKITKFIIFSQAKLKQPFAGIAYSKDQPIHTSATTRPMISSQSETNISIDDRKIHYKICKQNIKLKNNQDQGKCLKCIHKYKNRIKNGRILQV